jgi:hypothetical protein
MGRGAGLVLWAVEEPVVGHRAFHTIMTIATTTPTATQASKPHKNQDANGGASRSNSRFKLIMAQRAFEDLRRLNWQHRALSPAAGPKTDTVAEVTALDCSKHRALYTRSKRRGLMVRPITSGEAAGH